MSSSSRGSDKERLGAYSSENSSSRSADSDSFRRVNAKQSYSPTTANPNSHHLSMSDHEAKLAELNSKLANPLAGFSHQELQDKGAKYAREHGLEEYQEEFRKGAMLAADPKGYKDLPLLTDEDRERLDDEIHKKWKQPGGYAREVIDVIYTNE